MSDLKASTATSFFIKGFFKGSLSQSLFQWLSFGRFVQEQQTLSLSEDRQPTHLTEWLAAWQRQNHPTDALPAAGIVLWGAALMGCITMAGLLSVGLGSPINLWLPLVLFALLPLLMSLLSSTQLWSGGRTRPGHGYLWLLKVFRLQSRPDWLTESPRLIWPWLNWQLQQAACVFLVAALLTFFGFATFQELHFVWSSTFIQQDDTMMTVLAAMSVPWSWWLPSPGLDVVQATRYGTESDVQTGLWPLVVAAIVFYGLLPRIVLLLLFRRQLKQRLVDSIECSGTVEAFLNHQLQQVSQHALAVDDTQIEDVPVQVTVDATSDLGWRLANQGQSDNAVMPNLVRNLGLDDWQEEERWLASDAVALPHPVRMLVDFWQTPTGELEDCLQPIQANNSQLTLVLIHAPANRDAEREQAQLSSWRYFADNAGVTLVIEEQA